MRTSRWSEAGVLLAGAAVAAGALAAWWSGGADPALPWLVLVCLPLVVLLTRLPLNVSGGVDGLIVPLEPVVLLALLCLRPPTTSLAAWCLTAAAAYLLERRSWASRLVNTGNAAVSGLAATLAVALLAPDELVTPGHLLVVLAAAAAYFACDLAVSVAVVRGRTGASAVEQLRGAGTLRGLGVFAAVATLAFLSAVVADRLPLWVAGLLAVPLLAVVVAARSSREAGNRRRQQRALFEVSVAVHSATTREELCAALTTHAGDVVSADHLEVLADADAARSAADPGVLSVPVPAVPGEPARRLCTPRAPEAAQVREDTTALTSLAALLAASLARVRLAEEATRHALTDDLTGLANRRRMTRDLEDAVAADDPVAVLFVDLDGFKAVNDGLGHAAGDELLVETARRTRVAVAARCPTGPVTVARLGGDEFAVLVPDVDPGLAEDLAADVVAALSAPFLLAAGPAAIGASVGVTTSGPGDDADALLLRADAAMYEAKRGGGRRARCAGDGDAADHDLTNR